MVPPSGEGRVRRSLVPTVGLALALACPVFAKPKPIAPAPVAAPGTLLSVRDVMRHIVNPAAESYWKHTGVIDTEAGSDDRTPTADAEWTETVHAAAQVWEAGNLLMMQGRARDAGPWMTYAKQLRDAGVLAFSAAQARDHDKVFDAGGEIYNACFNCHARYIPRPRNSLWKQP